MANKAENEAPAGESRLGREIRQTRPFQSPADEAAVGLIRTADMVNRRFATLFEPFGITTQQYNVLRILRGARPEPLPTMEIAERMIQAAPGITRLLDRLDDKGLVRRKRCADDRRQVLCTITPAGLDLLEVLEEPVARENESTLDMLTEGEVRRLIRLMDRIRARLETRDGESAAGPSS